MISMSVAGGGDLGIGDAQIVVQVAPHLPVAGSFARSKADLQQRAALEVDRQGQPQMAMHNQAGQDEQRRKGKE